MSYPDFEEFIAALNAHGVRYVIVGAHAVAHHARPRATKDLDVFLDRDLANANRFLSALREFYRGADLGYAPEDITNPDWIVQLGVAPVRIDVITDLAGCPSFDEVWDRREIGVYSDVPTFYISLEDLLRSKRAAGRPQDKADIRTLLRVKPRHE